MPPRFSLDALHAIRRDLAHAARSLTTGPGVYARLRRLARHRHRRLRRARDLRPRRYRAGARDQHQRADRAPGAPARSSSRQSRRVGARTVVLSGLSGVARRRYRDGGHRLDQGVQRSSATPDAGRRRHRLVWRRCTCRPTTSAHSACRSRAGRDSIPRSTTRHRPSRASS